MLACLCLAITLSAEATELAASAGLSALALCTEDPVDASWQEAGCQGHGPGDGMNSILAPPLAGAPQASCLLVFLVGVVAAQPPSEVGMSLNKSGR